jgi:hypothetical protein
MRKLVFIQLIIAILSMAGASWGFQITEPKAGSIFYPGDLVQVRTDINTGENIEGVFFTVPEIDKGIGDLLRPYEYDFIIDRDYIGTATILAIARLSDGKGVQSEVKIKVVLPANVTLKSIDVDPNPVFLYKMPLNSDPNDIRIFETKSLGVGGMYSDGAERGIASASNGTTYASSNEKVVTVSPNGKVTAQSIGAAKIMVRNGKFSADVEVIVDPYKD